MVRTQKPNPSVASKADAGSDSAPVLRPARRDSLRLRFGQFSLDNSDFFLEKNGKSTALPLLPARLLFYLAERNGEIISRNEIQQNLWGSAPFGVEAAMNTCIRQVRRALGENAASPVFIETLPRRGYRFKGPVDKEVVPSPVEPLRKVPTSYRSMLPLTLCLFVVLIGGISIYQGSLEAFGDAAPAQKSFSAETRLQLAKVDYFRKAGDPESLEKAASILETLLYQHSDVALLYAESADVHFQLNNIEQALDRAQQALALSLPSDQNRHVGTAHHVMGSALLFRDWDRKAARRHLLRAVELLPGEPEPLMSLAFFYLSNGQVQAALAATEEAYKADILTPAVHFDAGLVYLVARRYTLAIRHCGLALEVTPNHAWGEDCIGLALVKSGRHREAADRIVPALLQRSFNLQELPWAIDSNPKRRLESFWSWRLQRLQDQKIQMPFYEATFAALLDDRETAISALERAEKEKSPMLLLLDTHPIFDTIRDEPRFEEMLRRTLPTQLLSGPAPHYTPKTEPIEDRS